MALSITSTAFKDQGIIPKKYTCDGQNINPALDISDVPEGTESLVLIMDDPDAPMGLFVHWVEFNIPTSKRLISENSGKLGMQGRNSFGKLGYGGPCPPAGTHRYFFKVYALDTELDLHEGASKSDVEKAMQNHIIAKAALTGRYSRS
jgi:hypothetical protein